MKTIITWLAVIIFLAGAGFYALNSYIYNEKQADFTEGETVSVSGVITSIDMSQATFDGPYLITLEQKNGDSVVVSVPSMGLPLCAAYTAKNIGDVYLMKTGLAMEARGIVSGNGMIVPCEYADHYLRPLPLVLDGFEGEADPARMTLEMKSWRWIRAQYNDGREVAPATDAFSLTFAGEGRFTATTDCNAMGGRYVAGPNRALTLDQIYATKMYCAGSQEAVFAKLLEDVDGYHFTSKGELILSLKFDSGTVTLR